MLTGVVMAKTKFRLKESQLRWHCDPDVFGFESTKDLEPLHKFIGQDRAIKALEFGLSMNYEGYNIYVSGLTGTGKTSAVKTHINNLLEEKQKKEQLKPLYDWCYLYDFGDQDRPQIVKLPQGKGKAFRSLLLTLLQNLKDELAKAFSSDEYKAQRKTIIEDGQAEQKKIADAIKEETRKQGFIIQITPVGQILLPVKDGKALSQEEYLALGENERNEIDTKRSELVKKAEESYEKVREQEVKIARRIQEYDRAIADFVVTKLFNNIINEYKDSEEIGKYLTDLQDYTLSNLDIFKQKEEQAEAIPGITTNYILQGRDPFLPFQVNVFIDSSESKGPPVIIESNPNYANLFGKIERRFLFGGYLSDHTMLKPGSIQMANGGYLLLNAIDVLTNPGVWPALKRMIKTKEVKIEEPYEQFGLFAPHGLRPQAMPVDIKILLIGDHYLYQMLSIYDEDFWEIFKVKADFDYKIDKNQDNMMHFASFIAGCCEKMRILHFHKTGVAKIIEYAARMVDDQEKLSSRFALIRELVQESEYWASRDNAPFVYDRHVVQAVEERIYRHNLPDARIKELIDQGIIMVDTDGSVEGQVNGLSVYSLGDIAFGKPSRITCKTFLGRGGVINIERESQLSGKIHDKGVLILSGYLGWKYAQDNPLSLTASLCFEQSYDGVEGDSASSAELYSLISSLSGVPINQGIAVTGSVNQKGEIQPIGGVNQKIEGFFQICNSKGLTGEQGVVIPFQNVRNLMLRQEVLDAFKANKFHIYAIKNVEEGIEILTGVKAGKKNKNNKYPLNSINYLVDLNLKEMARKMKGYLKEKNSSK
jgi:predicted ATP-dependent protease